jgi:hypothetical protein
MLPEPPFTPVFVCGKYIGAEPQKNLRTDLQSFLPWLTFENDIHNAIMAAMAAKKIPIGTQLEISKPIQMDDGEGEELGWVYHADCALQHAATVVLRRLGSAGRFKRTSAGNYEIIGEPDYVWDYMGIKHPRIVVRTPPVL